MSNLWTLAKQREDAFFRGALFNPPDVEPVKTDLMPLIPANQGLRKPKEDT